MGRLRLVRVGVTGPMGSGKSTLARELVRRGAVHIDADALARRATEDPEVLERIARELGSELLVDGRLDRSATARKVFSDETARRTLEGIVHPWVRAAAEELEAELSARPAPPPMVVHDVPLLFEGGLDARMDATVLVWAPVSVREARVALRGGDPSDVRARDAAQWPLERKVALADFVVSNDGDERALERQAASLWTALRMLRS